MDQKQLEACARDAAKSLKTKVDLNNFSQILTKITVEAALNTERDDHIGYNKHHQSSSNNSLYAKGSPASMLVLFCSFSFSKNRDNCIESACSNL